MITKRNGFFIKRCADCSEELSPTEYFFCHDCEEWHRRAEEMAMEADFGDEDDT